MVQCPEFYGRLGPGLESSKTSAQTAEQQGEEFAPGTV